MKVSSQMILAAVVVIIALTVPLSIAQKPEREPASTTVFLGATVLPVDADFSEAEALAIRGDKILAVGSRDSVLRAAGENATTVDVTGKTILPAFVDPHFHVLGTAQYAIFEFVGQSRFKTVEDALAHMTNLAAKASEGDWLIFRDLDLSTQSYAAKDISRKELDEISNTKPVFVWHAGGHIATVNGKMLELMGVTSETADPEGASYGKDEKGQLTGRLSGAGAILPALAKIEPYSNWDPVEGLKGAAPEWISRGLGTLGDTGTGPVTGGVGDLDALNRAAESGAFPLRVRSYLSIFFEDAWDKSDLKAMDGNDQIRLIGFKISADGSNQAKTGLQREPYPGSKDNRGIAYITQEELNQKVVKWSKKGYQLAIHGNGDAAIDNIITAVRKAQEQGVDLVRPRIEHCSIVHDDQLISMKELGLSGSFLIAHVKYWGGALVDIFGEKKAHKLDRAKSFERMKIPFSLHTDSPVVEITPLEMIEIAATRKVATRPEYVLAPAERISVESAIRAVTITPAWQMRSEKQIGSLEQGKLADLVILSADPRKTDPEKISNIGVSETWIGGQRVFSQEGSSR